MAKDDIIKGRNYFRRDFASFMTVHLNIYGTFRSHLLGIVGLSDVQLPLTAINHLHITAAELRL